MRRWAVVFLLALAVYLLTLQTGFSWQDSGGFQFRALDFRWRAEDMIGLGIALAHPAYVALCAFASRITALFGNPVVGVTAVSAFGAAVALANVWALVFFHLTERRALVASVATVLLGASHMFWWLATVAEVYTWSSAFLTTELLLLLFAARAEKRFRRGLLLTGLAAVTGLHLSFHNFALLAWPVYAVVFVVWAVKNKLGVWWLLPMVAAFCLGAAPFLQLTASAAMKSGIPFAVTNALVGDFSQEVMGVSERWAPLFKANMALHTLNYLNPLWLFLLVGVWFSFRKTGDFAARCILALAVIHFTFFIRYNVGDQATFALPTLTCFALLTAIGMDRVFGSRLDKFGLSAGAMVLVLAAAFPTCAYLGADAAVRRLNADALSAKEKIPFRDEVRYWILPWKMNEKSADRAIEAVLRETETNAVFYGYLVVSAPLIAKQLADPESMGDRKIVCYENFGGYRQPDNDTCRRLMKERPAYAMRRQDAKPAPGLGAIQQQGSFLRLSPLSPEN